MRWKGVRVMPVLRLNRRIRHYRRYRQIAEALIRQGFGYLVEQLELRPLIPIRRRLFWRDQEPQILSLGARMRTLFESLGPTFVKLGQLLSTRTDLLPLEVTQELARLQDDVPPISIDEVISVIESETGRTLDECFASFERVPLAAASIAQAHRAVLPDGAEVVVKVRRPGIEVSIETDIEILFGIAHLVEERLRPELLDPVSLIREFARGIRRELDFTIEGRNVMRFGDNFKEYEGVKIPKVYWEFTTPRLLVLEYVDAVKIDQFEALEGWGVDRGKLAQRVADAFLKQVMIDGSFHGDPHPGNLLVQADGSLALIDFGVVGRLDNETMTQLAEAFLGFMQSDADRVIKAMARMGALSNETDRLALRDDLSDLLDHYYGRSLKDVEMADVIAGSMEIAHRHRLRFPPDLLLLGRAFLTVEGVVKRLSPDFSVAEAAAPFAKDLAKYRLRPDRVARAAISETADYLEMLARIPVAVDRALDRLNRGEMEIVFHHRGLDRLINRIDIVSNRISFSVIIGALIVGSSLIIQAEGGPYLFDLPLLGVLGYVVAGIFGMGLILSIIRSGRL